MFLTREQLEELTGRRRASSQIRWLKEHGWAFAVRADGRPAVSLGEAQRQLESGTRARRTEFEPDFAVLLR